MRIFSQLQGSKGGFFSPMAVSRYPPGYGDCVKYVPGDGEYKTLYLLNLSGERKVRAD
jgi:hypothetical protein